MEKRLLFCLMAVIVYVASGSACPTCVGRVKARSAPFFSDECYQEVQIENTGPQAESANDGQVVQAKDGGSR